MDGNGRQGMLPEDLARITSQMQSHGGIRGNVLAGNAGTVNGNVSAPPAQQASPTQANTMQGMLSMPMQGGPVMPMQGMPNMGGQQQAQPSGMVTPPPPSVGQQRVSAQQELRNRMHQEQNSGATPQPTIITQTRNYQPDTPAQQMGGQQSAQQSQPNMGSPVNAQQATSTIINTTATDGIPQGGDNGGGGGFRLGKKVVYIIVAAILGLLLFAYFLFGGDKKEGGETEPTPTPEEPIEWLDPVGQEQFLYTPQEVDALRTAGYTGTEIEEYQTAQTPAQDLIDIAEARRDAWIKDSVVPLYDMASDEYKHQTSQTWLTLPQRTDAAEWTMISAYYTERKNLDYEKIDIYGNQLFIKVYLDDSAHEDWFFLCVTPDEWNKLSDQGNVIVNYTYCTHLVGDDYMSAVEDTENIFITQASLEIIQ